MPTHQEDLQIAFDPRSSRAIAAEYGVEKTYVLERKRRYNPSYDRSVNGVAGAKSEAEKLRDEVERLDEKLEAVYSWLRDAAPELIKLAALTDGLDKLSYGIKSALAGLDVAVKGAQIEYLP